MNIIVKSPVADPPYSLHDAHVLELRAEGDALLLVTQYGYICTTAPFEQVDGDVEVTEVDWESSYAYVMEYQDVLCGNCGSFTGRKMPLKTFVREFSMGSLDIMDETYGFRLAKLEGFLNLPGRCLEFQLEVCYTGDIRYRLQSDSAAPQGG